MSYILTRAIFPNGTIVVLPAFDPVDPFDTGGFTSRTLPLSGGGVYDPDGDDRLPRRERVITRQGQLIETSEAAIENAYKLLAVTSGQRVTLYRQNEPGTRAEHIRARVVVAVGDRAPRDIYRYRGYWVLDTTLTFELQEPIWHGNRHGTYLTPLDTASGLDLGIMLDDTADTDTLTSSPMTLTLRNDGNARVDDAIMRLLAGSAAITSFTYQCGKAKATWTGTLPAGNTLVIDSGNARIGHETLLTADAPAGATVLSVANAAGTGWAAGAGVRLMLTDGTFWYGVIASVTGTTSVGLTTGLPGPAASGRGVIADAYSGFARDPVLHSIDAWLRLSPGDNLMTVTLAGGGVTSTLSRAYWDGYR